MTPDDRTLRWLLAPVERWLTDPATTDFCVNGPRRAFVKRAGAWLEVETPYDLDDLLDLGHHAAGFRRQDIGRAHPLCVTASPWGHRVQIVQEPCVVPGAYSFTARQPPSWEPTLDVLDAKGVFEAAKARGPSGKERALAEAARLHRAGDVKGLLAWAAVSGLTVGASGLMGSGKTTCLRAAAHEVPRTLRIASIEDEGEARLRQPNRAELVYSHDGQGEAQVGAQDLMVALLRMGVQRAFIQEIRNGKSALAFLRLAATLPTMTTNHGDSCFGFFESTRLMVKTDPVGAHMRDEDVFSTLNEVIDLVVHCHCDDAKGGSGYSVDDVWLKGVDPPMAPRKLAEAA